MHGIESNSPISRSIQVGFFYFRWNWIGISTCKWNNHSKWCRLIFNRNPYRIKPPNELKLYSLLWNGFVLQILSRMYRNWLHFWKHFEALSFWSLKLAQKKSEICRINNLVSIHFYFTINEWKCSFFKLVHLNLSPSTRSYIETLNYSWLKKVWWKYRNRGSVHLEYWIWKATN